MATVKYPRVYVSAKLHARVARAAKKEGATMKVMGDEVVKAGLKVLGY